jgi:allantoicase
VRADSPVTHVRLDVFPDGGLARFRVLGELTG